MMTARRIASAILHPPLPVLIAAPFAITAMMAWVFLLGNKGHPLSYAFYALSFYLLVAICANVFGGRNLQRARRFASRNRLAKRVLNDEDYRLCLSVAFGIAVDALWAVANLAQGALNASAWFITLGCYYLLFGLMRGLLLARLRGGLDAADTARSDRAGRAEDVSRPSRASRHARATERDRRALLACGAIMVVSTFVLSGIVTLLLHGDATIRYGKIETISLAAFTFYSLTSAIVGLVRMRRRGALIVANCRVNLCIALVSLFTLEMAMLAAFGTNDDPALTLVLPALTGAAVAVALCAMGILTLRQARR